MILLGFIEGFGAFFELVYLLLNKGSVIFVGVFSGLGNNKAFVRITEGAKLGDVGNSAGLELFGFDIVAWLERNEVVHFIKGNQSSRHEYLRDENEGDGIERGSLGTNEHGDKEGDGYAYEGGEHHRYQEGEEEVVEL